MHRRLLGLSMLVLCVGCHAVGSRWLREVKPTAGELWERGQAAMRRGNAAEAIRCYQESLRADPGLDRNHLSLAAAYLEQGDEAAACPHLAQYVAAHPEHVVIRAHLAELLFRLERYAEARHHFEQCVALGQEEEGPANRRLILCHSRLMEIAELSGDEYAIHLHRGIGLFLLALERSALPEAGGLLPTESLLCKAAGELSLARLERPDEARPSWYLYEVWSRLPLRQAALRHLRAAAAAAPFSYLTPAEHRSLQLAWRCQSTESC
ncbi:MAG: tetratricopeptide repeat protein [Gemmataceae bacterium]|nr:tetratricopeptide repeat protein [Gemmataceae bacterium]